MITTPRLLRITTVPISLEILLHGQLNFFRNQGFEVLAASSPGKEAESLRQGGIPHVSVVMTRKITPLRDIISLFHLIRLIRSFRPDIVHTHTPKAGLLGMVASWFCKVPVRMHTVAGLPLMEATGLKKALLFQAERITYACATSVYPNSVGLKQFIRDSIPTKTPLSVIGKGSSNGIDTSFFIRTRPLEAEATRIRQQQGWTETDIVFCFVGRVVRDKGIGELVKAFKDLLARWKPGFPRLFLLLVGPLEQDLDPLHIDDLHFLKESKNVFLAGFQTDVRPWMMASDIFVFPSYREGFPNVVMQASCLEVPSIVSDINGCNEIIRHRETGLIVPVKDSVRLASAMEELLHNPDMRKAFGRRSREFVIENYDQQYVWQELLKEYMTAIERG